MRGKDRCSGPAPGSWTYVIVFLVLCVPAGVRAADPAGMSLLAEGWVYFQGDTDHWPTLPPKPGTGRWLPYRIDMEIPENRGRYLLLKRPLSSSFENPSLFFPRMSISQALEIYLDDRRIGGIGKMEPDPVNPHLYVRWYMVPLPRDCDGKTLYVRFFSEDPSSIGFRLTPVLGEQVQLTQEFLFKNPSRFLLAAAFFVAGLIGLLLYIRTWGAPSRPLRAFVALAVFAGIYIVIGDTNQCVLLSEDPLVLSRARYVTFFLFLGGLWWFYTVTLGPGQWYSGRIMFYICFGSAAGVIPLDLVAGRYVKLFFDLCSGIQMVGIACYFITLIQNVLRGQAVARILCLGIIAMAVAGFHDLFRSIFMADHEPVLFPWGLLILIGSMIWVIAYLYRRERQEAEEVLRASEEKYRSLFENAPLSILETDLAARPARILKHNRHAAATMGLAGDGGRASLLDDIFPSGDVDRLPGIRRETGAGNVYTKETMCRRTNGERFPARLIATAAALPGPAKTIIALQDITDEKQRRSEEAAIAEERQRIAREIHDGLAQDLASLRMRAGIWHKLMKKDPERMHRELDEYRDLLSHHIREVRRSIFALRSLNLEEMGFYPALEKLIKGFEEQNSFRAEFTVLGNRDRLPGRLETVVFRIIQEALNNAAKHARARQVEICLDVTRPDVLVLVVQDDGRGIDREALAVADRTGHLGVRQMKERVAGLGGVMGMGNREPSGTVITISLPMVTG